MPAKKEASEARGLKELAERQRKEEHKMRMLREVAEFFQTNWPVGKRERTTSKKGTTDTSTSPDWTMEISSNIYRLCQ
jgi:hypothetical protein